MCGYDCIYEYIHINCTNKDADIENGLEDMGRGKGKLG